MGCTPLLYSLLKGQNVISEYLVSQGASITGNTCQDWSSRGFTAFHYAAFSGSIKLLQLLLEKAPSQLYVCRDPIHPLHLAVLHDNAECVRVMIGHVREGMNSFSQRLLLYANMKTDTGKGRTLSDQLGTLREAVGRMMNMKVQGDMFRWSWASSPGKLFPKEFNTATPLHIAARGGHSQVVRMLLDYGASIDDLDSGLGTPLHYAAANGQTAVIKILLDSGANPNAVDSYLDSPCMAAASNGHVESVRTLLKVGVDTQLRNRYGQTALHLAAISGAKNVFVLLMSTMSRHDLGAEDIWGEPVLYGAICRESDYPMSLLLSHTPPVAAFESQTDNILIAAIENRPASDIRQLLRRLPTSPLRRFLDYRALYGGTPLHVAATMAKLDTMNLLLDAGAQLEPEGSEHGTALMGACATGRLAAVKLLVARGARTSYVKDGQFYSALLAAKYHPEVRRWLLVGRFLEGPRLITWKEIE